MPGSRYILNAIALLLAISIYSCDDKTSSSQSPFEITVTDTDGLPLEGAIVAGGLDISAETPAEIAVSIVAELIHTRAQGDR